MVRTVLPYVYAAASDAGRVIELYKMAADRWTWSSSPAHRRLIALGGRREQNYCVTPGRSGQTKVAAVGPIVADNLRSAR